MRGDAYNELGIDSTTEGVDFEVVQQPEKKKLGLFGGKDAKVKVTFKEKESPAKVATEYLRNILNALGLTEIEMTVKEDENGAEINLEGEGIGYVIGRRGDTLNALQYLTGLVANHVENNYYRISINTGNYREKREKTLEILGRKLAFKAAKTGAKTALEPMNPYERRIIHTAVQEIEGVTSRSIGSGMDRRVLIEPEGGVKHPYRNDRRGGRRPASPIAPVDANREKKVDRADIPKFGKIQVNKDND